MPSQTLSVLIADGDVGAATALANWVGMLGHSPRVAHNARDAVRMAAAPFPDVVVLDVRSPYPDGYALATCLRAFLPRHTLFVAVTALPGYEGWSRVEGIDHHLTKPVQVADLEDLLRRHAQSRA